MKQQIDSLTFVLFYILGMLWLRIPSDFLSAKLVGFCLVVCAATVCFFASQEVKGEK
jgi:hypothetical protein